MTFPHKLIQHHIALLIGLIGICLISGCASYKLGSPTEIPFESIYVKPASNDSFAPQAQALVSSEIRQAFIRDGRVKIVTKEEDADAVLLVNLTDYNRSPVSRNRDDTIIARDFDLTLYAEAALFNSNRGDYYFERRVLSESTRAYVNNPYQSSDAQDFLQSEYQAMSQLAQGIARKIADEVLSPWPAKETPQIEEEIVEPEIAPETMTITAEAVESE